MDTHKTPPLTWLRTFEAAGRLGSFKAAAHELSLSPSTVSHQIRDLEAMLGQPLFSRGAKRVELTPQGERLLTPLVQAFTLLRTATTAFHSEVKTLRIGAFPFVVNEILAPAAGELKDVLAIPHLALSTETNKLLLSANDERSRLDVIIRYGQARGQQPSLSGIHERYLFDVQLTPVMSVSDPPVIDAHELLERPLIRVEGPFDGWQRWADALGIREPPSNVVLETDSYHAAALAVARGEGICLGVFPFMQPWVEQHRIIPLDTLSCPLSEAAYLFCASHQADNPVIDRLANWLLDRLGVSVG